MAQKIRISIKNGELHFFFQNVTKTNDHCQKKAFLLKAILSEAMTTMLTQEPKKLSVQIKVEQ